MNHSPINDHEELKLWSLFLFCWRTSPSEYHFFTMASSHVITTFHFPQYNQDSAILSTCLNKMHVEYSRHMGKKYGRWHVVFVFEFEENYVLFYSIVTSSKFQGKVGQNTILFISSLSHSLSYNVLHLVFSLKYYFFWMNEWMNERKCQQVI